MRLRFAVLASVIAATAVAPATGVTAAPRHHRTITINTTPNPVNAGGGVLIYGQLQGSQIANKTIRLFQHISGTPGFLPAGSTKTNSFGFYEFTRTVETNRVFFVRGPGGARSRDVRERVAALVTLSASSTNTDTRHPIVFSGHLTPNHAGERVYLQEQKATSVGSEEWHTISSAVIGPGSSYSIRYRFVIPGDRDVRALFRGDARNIKSASDPVTVTVQQAQVPGFTINTSAPIIPEGGGATISGVLDRSATGGPEPNTSVTLWGRTADQPRFVPLASTNTGADGSYSFAVHPAVNTEYFVRTTFAPRRQTATLFEGVRDVLTLQASSSISQVGGEVTLSGTVSPDKAGSVIYLQLLGADGDWHNVELTRVRFDSTYRFAYRFGEPGAHRFRTHIVSDKRNVGAVSPVVTVAVTGAAPITTLPKGK